MYLKPATLNDRQFLKAPPPGEVAHEGFTDKYAYAIVSQRDTDTHLLIALEDEMSEEDAEALVKRMLKLGTPATHVVAYGRITGIFDRKGRS